MQGLANGRLTELVQIGCQLSNLDLKVRLCRGKVRILE